MYVCVCLYIYIYIYICTGDLWLLNLQLLKSSCLLYASIYELCEMSDTEIMSTCSDQFCAWLHLYVYMGDCMLHAIHAHTHTNTTIHTYRSWLGWRHAEPVKSFSAHVQWALHLHWVGRWQGHNGVLVGQVSKITSRQTDRVLAWENRHERVCLGSCWDIERGTEGLQCWRAWISLVRVAEATACTTRHNNIFTLACVWSWPRSQWRTTNPQKWVACLGMRTSKCVVFFHGWIWACINTCQHTAPYVSNLVLSQTHAHSTHTFVSPCISWGIVAQTLEVVIWADLLSWALIFHSALEQIAISLVCNHCECAGARAVANAHWMIACQLTDMSEHAQHEST